MSKQEAPADIGAMSFEDALKELEQIVSRLESSQGTLEEAIDAYERGVALKRHCEKKLKEAEARVEKISLSVDGTVSASPADTA
ncbi:MAG: exodeoxyribonuclease VII small subunit [Alphaproteobacteria bacterium]